MVKLNQKELTKVMMIFDEEVIELVMRYEEPLNISFRVYEDEPKSPVYLYEGEKEVCVVTQRKLLELASRFRLWKTFECSQKLLDRTSDLTFSETHEASLEDWDILSATVQKFTDSKIRPSYENGRCFLTYRSDIAGMINISGYPSIAIDKGFHGRKRNCYCEGSKCRILYTSKTYGTYPVDTELYFEGGVMDVSGKCENEVYALSGRGSSLTAIFNQHTIRGLIERNSTPLLKPNDYVVVVEYIGRFTNVVVMKVSEKVDIFSTRIADIKDLTEAEYQEFYDWYIKQQWSK